MKCEQKHILIIEDSADERDLYALHLSLKGFRVSKAEDGKEGLDKAFELRPDLILIDLWLPTIGGWRATQLLRADQRTRDCAVVVITGHPIIRPKTLECDGWLTKPCPLDQLDAEIARVLEARAQCKGLSPHRVRTEPAGHRSRPTADEDREFPLPPVR